MSDVEDVGAAAGGAGPAAPSIRPKEIGATSVACPMLTPTNYTVWSLRMKVVLKIHKVWYIIDSNEKNEDRDNLAMGLLYQAIPEALIMQLGDVEDFRSLWLSIKSRYLGADRVREARLQTLVTEFDRFKVKEIDSIDSIAGRLSEIAVKSASLGEPINEVKMVKKILTVVPHKFLHLVASLEQVLDLNTVGFEDIIGRLKAFDKKEFER